MVFAVIQKTKPPQSSRVFEQLNMDRLHKCASTLARTEQLLKEASRQLEASAELLERLRQQKKQTPRTH